MPCPPRGRASTAPVWELRRSSRLERPDSSRAATTEGVAAVADAFRTVTLVPAVTYSPASTTQSSPSEMPIPLLAPSRQRSPMLIRSAPPPERVPMIEARSEEHTSELQSRGHLVCRLLLERKKKNL